jgi:hypothetical protein
MSKSEKGGWCGWPDHSNMRATEDLFKLGARCDAWRIFFKSKAIASLKKINGHIIWFNRYEYFDKLICEFDCPQKQLISVLSRLMHPDHRVHIEFLRNDIYDARAWCYLPLSCFVNVEGFAKRTGIKHLQSEILEINEMPVVEFGIKLPWTVTRDCFTLTHRIKGSARFAEMTFAHPQLDPRFNNCRWVADGMFPRETERKEMEDVLFARVQAECSKHQVTIVDTK